MAYIEYVVDKFGRKFKKEKDWQPTGHWNQPVPNMKLFVKNQHSDFTYYAHSDENGNIVLDEEMTIPAHIREYFNSTDKLIEPKIILWKYAD